MKNNIGIDQEKAIVLSEKLNFLLSDYQVFYQNLRGFHWNIKGADFFELHLKFEEFYTDAAVKTDELAERILTLGGVPLHSFSDYLRHADIEPVTHESSGRNAVETIMDNFAILIRKERVLLALSGEAQDEGTNSLMSGYISQTEKTLWMLGAYLQ